VSVVSVRLENVAQVVRGVSFDKAEVSAESIEGMVPILRAGNISDVLDTGSDLIWVPAARVKQEQLLRSGDIAICMSSGSQSVVGKSAPLRCEWTGSVGAFCAIVRPRPERVEPEYLALYMRSEGFRTWTRKSEGANIKNIRH
jgi:type I restriction enzyme, S subunit